VQISEEISIVKRRRTFNCGLCRGHFGALFYDIKRIEKGGAGGGVGLSPPEWVNREEDGGPKEVLL
jgi:hypothetical protein